MCYPNGVWEKYCIGSIKSYTNIDSKGSKSPGN